MLRVDGLSYEYCGAGSKILDRADLELRKGEVVLLAGPTGSGKSTLALLAAGILQRHGQGVWRGSITLDGRDVSSIAPMDLSRYLGIMFQNIDIQLFHDLVGDDIAFGPENLGFSPKSVSSCVEMALSSFGLCSYRDQRLDTLSGGYRQRVALAGMIAMGQNYLILDEPLAFLDRHSATSLMTLLSRIKEQTGVLVVEHRIDLAKTADRTIYLSNGKALPGCPPDSNTGLSCFGPGGPTLMRAHGIYYSFSNKKAPVLKNCSLELCQGISHVVLGDNGCGKTTLLKVLAGLYRPDAGIVKIKGSKRRKRRPFPGVALVLQDPDHQLFMPTVAEEVLAFNNNDASPAEQSLAELRLDTFVARHPQSLSRGQKRRLALAAALAGRPRTLLLDEPTVGQDPESLRLMLLALKRFINEGGVLLSATHDYHAARALGQVVWRMEQGRILEKGGLELVERYFRTDLEQGNG